MKQRHWLVAAAAGAFVASFTATLPATLALRWLMPDSTSAIGVSGTAWNGSAAGLALGPIRLGKTSWQVSALSLLGGRLRADIEATMGAGSAKGIVTAGLGGYMICEACQYSGPVSTLKPLFPALAGLEGRLDLAFDSIEIEDGWPVRIMGKAVLADMPITLNSGMPTASRGSFEAGLSSDPVPEDGRIEILVKDTDGPLQLTATVVVMPPGNFELTGQAKPRANAPAALAGTMAGMGRRNPDGSTEIALSGTF